MSRRDVIRSVENVASTDKRTRRPSVHFADEEASGEVGYEEISLAEGSVTYLESIPTTYLPTE